MKRIVRTLVRNSSGSNHSPVTVTSATMDSQNELVEEEKGLFDAESGVDYLSGYVEMPKSPTQLKSGSDAADSSKSYTYEPVVWHWFYLKEIDKKSSWKPFSMLDSVALEDSYQLLMEGSVNDDEAVVSADGGRYDVHVAHRIRTAVYWEEPPSEVRRCSWFYKGPLELTYIPYEEDMAEKLEEEYHNAVDRNLWHRILEFPHGEKITFQTPNVMLHFPNTGSVDDWNQVTDRQMQALIVKRGIDGFDISDGEATTIDHLIFLVHGIGSVCDFRFRPIEQVVDDFRNLSYQLLRSHFPSAVESNTVGRVEFLPVSWHDPLHGDDTGIDKRLQPITLPSIPKLRHFANDTILDVLFYTSPVYCETIISTVGLELNRLYNTFMQRNPTFKGQISLGGHSLGSLILFDLLSHQPQSTKIKDTDVTEKLSEDSVGMTTDLADPTLDEICQVLHLGEYLAVFEKEQLTFGDLLLCSEEDLASLGLPMGPRKRLTTYLRDVEIRRAKLKQSNSDIPPHSSTVSYTIGLAGTGQPSVSYPLLNFHPAAFYALGSPVAMFVCVRGIDRLGEDFFFPTCPKFFNIFHPYDPVAYRIETLIDPQMVDVPPVLIPHHKGRKRMHIELKETITRVSADLERFLGSVRTTWNNLASFRTSTVALQEEKEEEEQAQEPTILQEQVVHIGKLNCGNRIDYVLQEAPLESFNEYLFALTSHVGYWESEDTMLMILKETYSSLGVYPDKTTV